MGSMGIRPKRAMCWRWPWIGDADEEGRGSFLRFFSFGLFLSARSYSVLFFEWRRGWVVPWFESWIEDLGRELD